MFYFRSQDSPLKAKKAARKYEKEFEGVWSSDKWHSGYKDFIMKRGLIYKFSQNADLLKRLVDTGKAKIVEASFKDPYWGGMLPESKNRLGDMLVELRDNYVKDGMIYMEGSQLEPIKP